MSKKDISKELMSFIDKSYSVFHAVAEFSKILITNGYTQLNETDKWNLEKNGKYFTVRNSSSVIAFTYPGENFSGFNLIASHSDSPCFKIKDKFDIKVKESYTKLNTERYGGMIMSTWFDRPLSVAGRVMINTDNGIELKLINIDKDLLVIPNLAIHMDREVNTGKNFNPQNDLLPLLGDENADLGAIIAESIGVEKDDILSHDLFLYPREKARFLGANSEYILAPKLDDLQCAFSSISAIVKSDNNSRVNVAVVFDNEEVGSRTKQGANSTFLYDTLKRICKNANKDDEDYMRAVANSFMISADNAHAVHPNNVTISDETNFNFLNKGPVIKYSASQSYSTDAVSAAIFKTICDRADVPYQVFHNRSDMPGGGTLGNISTGKVSMNSVDIGLPQFAMHSALETAGSKDTDYAIKAFNEFYDTDFDIDLSTIKLKNTKSGV